MRTGHREVALLRLLATPKVGNVRASKVMEWCKSHGVSVEDFVSAPRPIDGALTSEMANSIPSSREQADRIAGKLSESGVVLLEKGTAQYPDRMVQLLGQKAPPVLFVLGNLDLLASSSVGFCGSRNASKKGLATAADCAEQLAQSGTNVVSGYAAGVDLQAHTAALAAGGTTTVVLAEGILHFAIRESLQDLWDWKRVVVISEFAADASWAVGHAMQRNWTICALSQVVILIEARAAGGSAEAGKACLRLGLPLFASEFEGSPESASGNRELLRSGAKPLLKNKATGRANLKKVHELLHRPSQVAVAEFVRVLR